MFFWRGCRRNAAICFRWRLVKSLHFGVLKSVPCNESRVLVLKLRSVHPEISQISPSLTNKKDQKAEALGPHPEKKSSPICWLNSLNSSEKKNNIFSGCSMTTQLIQANPLAVPVTRWDYSNLQRLVAGLT